MPRLRTAKATRIIFFNRILHLKTRRDVRLRWMGRWVCEDERECCDAAFRYAVGAWSRKRYALSSLPHRLAATDEWATRASSASVRRITPPVTRTARLVFADQVDDAGLQGGHMDFQNDRPRISKLRADFTRASTNGRSRIYSVFESCIPSTRVNFRHMGS